MPDITQTCRITGQSFVVTEVEQAMLAKLAPVVGGVSYPLPHLP